MALLASYNPAPGLNPGLFRAYMVVGGIGTILTAGYFLWMLQRVNLGKLPERWQAKRLFDVQPLELLSWAPLLLLIIGLGLFPRLMFGVTNESVVHLVKALGL
jgi:NADH-quinone oxidoreductase subunit M